MDKILNASYEVRGELPILANQIEKNIAEYPFNKIIYCNIGNPLALIPKPIKAYRKFISNELLKNNFLNKNLGSYSPSNGFPEILTSIQEFINLRDETTTHQTENNYLINGATEGIHHILKLYLWNKDDIILLPKPGYPIYQAMCDVYDGKTIYYDLDENQNWSINKESLFSQIQKYQDKIKLIVIINPNNPTGSIIPHEELLKICHFISTKNIPIIADEVYQENDIDNKFISIRKSFLTLKLNSPLFSLHSVSKGFIGECGLRGGYLNTLNIPTKTKNALEKYLSMRLSANSIGQLAVHCMTKLNQKNSVKKQIAKKKLQYIDKLNYLYDELNFIKGVSCSKPQGTMYVFPKIQIKENIKIIAKYEKKEPDFIWCREFLKKYGICVVPGSGFGQPEGTFHFRMTILPEMNDLKYFINCLTKFME